MGIPAYIDLTECIPSRQALVQLPVDVARRLQVLPIAFNEAALELTLALNGEPSLPVKDTLRRSIDKPLQMHWIQADSALISASIEACYHHQHDLLTLLEQCWAGGSKPIAMPSLVDALLCRAMESRASDIHISASDDAIELRLRIDGVLSDLGRLPRRLLDALTVRVKIMGELDIAETRRPQDGQFRRLINGVFVECRLSTFPTCRGENIVVRLLGQKQRHRNLEELALTAATTRQLRALVRQPGGMLIVCGPTGSGKSSTLFSLLGERDIATLNVMSLEDPVEIRLPGIRQSNVDSDRGLDFAAGVRALLRQDPDVLLIGEMRDADSAAMAFRAAMTGHQVLTTVHAADAFSTIDRLRELGISAEVLSSTVRGIVAQRLLRKRCDCCSGGKHEIGPDVEAGAEHVRQGAWHRVDGAADCNHCHGAGYYGRQAIAEVLRFTKPVRENIMAHRSPEELHECALHDGFVSLRDAAQALLLAGITSIAEIDRVLGHEGMNS